MTAFQFSLVGEIWETGVYDGRLQLEDLPAVEKEGETLCGELHRGKGEERIKSAL